MNTIKRIRTERLKLSQSRMAEICGTHQTTVGRWERGEFPPTLDELHALLRYAREADIPLEPADFFPDEPARAA